jgi:hypothetical protein
MSPVTACRKGDASYCYYVSEPLQSGADAERRILQGGLTLQRVLTRDLPLDWRRQRDFLADDQFAVRRFATRILPQTIPYSSGSSSP